MDVLVHPRRIQSSLTRIVQVLKQRQLLLHDLDKLPCSYSWNIFTSTLLLSAGLSCPTLCLNRLLRSLPSCSLRSALRGLFVGDGLLWSSSCRHANACLVGCAAGLFLCFLHLFELLRGETYWGCSFRFRSCGIGLGFGLFVFLRRFW